MAFSYNELARDSLCSKPLLPGILGTTFFILFFNLKAAYDSQLQLFEA